MARAKRLSWARFAARSDTHRRIRLTFQYVNRKLNAALNESEGVEFTDDERDIIAHDLNTLRTRLDEFQRAIERAK
jgi:hypothetical protein